MADQGSRRAGKSQFVSQVTFGTIIHDALREAKGFRPGMRSQSRLVRSPELTHTTVFLINRIQRQPEHDRLNRLNHEIMPVLMGRSRSAHCRTLVEVLQIFTVNGLAEQMFRDFLKRGLIHQSGKIVVMHLELLQLLQGVLVFLMIIVHFACRHSPNDFLPDSKQFGVKLGHLCFSDEILNDKESVLLKAFCDLRIC